jgi:AraC-like DNA-binding protein
VDQVGYRLRAPDPRVAGLLDRAYLLFSQPAATRQSWLATPTTSVTLIINFGAPFSTYPTAFVAGLTSTCDVIEQHGAIECADLKLSPLGAYTLLGLPMDELSDQVVDLSEVLGGGVLDQLTETPAWADRFALLDSVLVDRAVRGPQPAAEVCWALRRLTTSHGAIPIGALATEVGWSRRHLVSRFRQQVGLPPKTMARIIRFQQLLSGLRTDGPTRWTQLAEECGYYDQAHMNRDFREFAGTTPTDYVSRLVRVGTQVTSVQYTWVPAS